eukprot:1336220-Alexandrium_andersonii.AAC.1
MANWERGKVHDQTWRQINASIGTYMSLGKVAEQFGIHADRDSALRSACTYAEACVKLGGSWVRYCGMSKTIMFLFLSVTGVETEFMAMPG